MKKKILTGLLCGIVLLVLTGVTYASSVTINISAEVAYIDDFGRVLGESITVGTMFYGHYTYDTATPNTHGTHGYDDGTVGDYEHNSSPYGITLSGGGFLFATDPSNADLLVEVCNNHGGYDYYLLLSYNNLPLSNGASVGPIYWQLDDRTMSALSSIELTTSPPNLSDWQSVFGLSISGSSSSIDNSQGFPMYNIDQFFIRAHVTSAELAPANPVPAPTTMLLNAVDLRLVRCRNLSTV